MAFKDRMSETAPLTKEIVFVLDPDSPKKEQLNNATVAKFTSKSIQNAFSNLKRSKSFPRNCMGQERLSALTAL